MDGIERTFRLLEAVSERATCDRGRSGCIIITPMGEILSTGWVTSPRGQKTCDSSGHEFDESGQHCIRTIHAEQHAISAAAREGTKLQGSLLFCTMTPCLVCAKMVIESGIKEVYCSRKYKKADASEDLFYQAGIKICYQSEEILKY